MAKPKRQITPEDEITFNLLDVHTVDRLRRTGDIKLPRKTLDVPKDEKWNTKQMSSRLLQGILNGDSIPKIADRLMDIVGNNEVSAIRNARTMVTGAENVGRLDSYKDLAEKGVVQRKIWIATLDDRTRESHAEIDGEEVEIDKAFSNGLMYPGDTDPSVDPSEVWNCRCSMRDHIVGFRRADGSISYIEGEEPKNEVIQTEETTLVSADEFRRSAEENLAEDEQKELYEELDKYIDSVSGDTERLAELLDQMDDIKWNSEEPVYRGIGVQGYDPISGKNTFEDLLTSYENGEPFTMQSLSWSAQEDIAMQMAESKGTCQIIYVDTTQGQRDMISIQGITEETEGKWYADHTQEVLATRTDLQFEPYRVERDGNVAHVYVREIQAEETAVHVEAATLDHYDETYQEFRAERADQIKDMAPFDEMTEMLNELVDENEFRTRIPDDDANILECILDDGKFKTQFETDDSMGVYAPATRMRASHNLFGTDVESMEDSQWEKYGYLGSSSLLDDRSIGLAGYGDGIVTFDKDALFDRTTLTVGDSLRDAGESDRYIMGTMVNNIDSTVCIGRPSAIDTYVQLMRDSIETDGINNASRVGHAVRSYIELQYHGDVTLADVESITIRKDIWDEIAQNPDRVNALRENNITCYYIDYENKELKEYVFE